MKKLFALLIAIVVAIATIAASLYFGLLPTQTARDYLRDTPVYAWLTDLFLAEPEYSARYYPYDTFAYGWFTLRPRGGQHKHMTDLWDKFNEYSAFRNWRSDFEDEFESTSGIDIEEDIASWIGAEISVGILDIDFDTGEIQAAATIDIRDHEAAERFIRKWAAYMEDEMGSDFDRDAIGDFEVWEDEDATEVAIALSNNLLVVTSSRATLDEMIQHIGADGERTLAANPQFTEAREWLPAQRFMSVYADGYKINDSLADVLQSACNQAGYDYESFCAYIVQDGYNIDPLPEWIASSAEWVERGVVWEIVSPNLSQDTLTALDAPELTDVARLMPQDTLGFLALSFDPVVDNWRSALDEYAMEDILPEYALEDLRSEIPDDVPPLEENMTLAHFLDFAILGFDIMTGIDIERQFFDYLGGEVVLTLREFDIEAVSMNPEDNPIDTALMLSYRQENEEDLQDTMQDFVDTIKFYAEDTNSYWEQVGANNDAQLIDVGATASSPGYVLHDGYLTIGSDRFMLETIVALQKGETDALNADPEYRRTMNQLPNTKSLLAYLNLQRIVSQLGRDATGLRANEHKLLREIAGTVAASANVGDDRYRFTLAFILFPEELKE